MEPAATEVEFASIVTGERKMKIILVEDTLENLLSLGAALSRLGEELVLARSGTDALRCLLQDDFAAIENA